VYAVYLASKQHARVYLYITNALYNVCYPCDVSLWILVFMVLNYSVCSFPSLFVQSDCLRMKY